MPGNPKEVREYERDPQGDGLQSFGKLLRDRRLEMELSLIRAARLTGISEAHLGRLENDTRKNPSLLTAMSLSRLYGISLDVMANYVSAIADRDLTQKILQIAVENPTHKLDKSEIDRMNLAQKREYIELFETTK